MEGPGLLRLTYSQEILQRGLRAIHNHLEAVAKRFLIPNSRSGLDLVRVEVKVDRRAVLLNPPLGVELMSYRRVCQPCSLRFHLMFTNEIVLLLEIGRLTRTRCLLPFPVRRASALPSASFRFPVAQDAVAVSANFSPLSDE